MSVRIEIKQERTVEADTTYRVKTTVIYVEDIQSQIFVHNTESQEFEHVAYPYDMTTYPASREEALAAGAAYYRAEVANVVYTNVTTAEEAAVYTRYRVGLLTGLYAETVDSFAGTDEYAYTEAD